MPISVGGQTFYMTSEACVLAGTNRHTFLRWVREGMFTDVEHRDRNGWRLFAEDDIHRLRDKVHSIHKIVIKKPFRVTTQDCDALNGLTVDKKVKGKGAAEVEDYEGKVAVLSWQIE